MIVRTDFYLDPNAGAGTRLAIPGISSIQNDRYAKKQNKTIPGSYSRLKLYPAFSWEVGAYSEVKHKSKMVALAALMKTAQDWMR